MTRLEHLTELRRDQGVRVVNASRHKRDRELALYRQIDDLVTEAVAHAEEDTRRPADAA